VNLPIGFALVLGMAASLERAPTLEPSEVVVRADLDIDTSELGSEGPILYQRVLERGSQIFRDGHVLPAQSGADPRVAVTLRPFGEEEPGFAFEILIESNGRISDEGQWTVRCRLCTETELVDRVAGELAKVVSTLTTFATQPDVTEPETVVPESEAEVNPEPDIATQPATEPNDEAEAKSGALGILTKVGIGALVVGVASAGAGAGLIAVRPQPLSDDPLMERYTQPPGYALVAVGGAAIVAGVVLVVVGQRRSKVAKRAAVHHGGVVVRF